MKVLLFLGCTVQTEQYAYELSVRSVLPKLGVELIDMPESNCCGYPVKSISPMAWAYMAGRLMAIAEREGLPLLTLCNGCHLSLTELKWALTEQPDLLDKLNELLEPEGLKLEGKTEVIHVLEFLYDRLGPEAIREHLARELRGLRLAAHYGCHLLRPSTLGRPDDPENPRKLDELIEALGASPVDYPGKLDCCGSGLAPFHGREAMKMVGWKLLEAKKAGVDALVVMCPFCMKMLDGKQTVASRLVGQDVGLPVVYYTQLLGLAMGMSPGELGLELNLSPVERLLAKMGVKM